MKYQVTVINHDVMVSETLSTQQEVDQFFSKNEYTDTQFTCLKKIREEDSDEFN